MISASTLPCYSALSPRILTTNHLITFLTLHSHYPFLQPINTYYSLIGVIYVFRVCALFCLRIASPLLYQYYPMCYPSLVIVCSSSLPRIPHRIVRTARRNQTQTRDIHSRLFRRWVQSQRNQIQKPNTRQRIVVWKWVVIIKLSRYIQGQG